MRTVLHVFFHLFRNAPNRKPAVLSALYMRRYWCLPIKNCCVSIWQVLLNPVLNAKHWLVSKSHTIHEDHLCLFCHYHSSTVLRLCVFVCVSERVWFVCVCVCVWVWLNSVCQCFSVCLKQAFIMSPNACASLSRCLWSEVTSCQFGVLYNNPTAQKLLQQFASTCRCAVAAPAFF